MSSLTRDQILAKRFDLPREAVDVPALGGPVYVRVLSLAELVRLQADEQAMKAAGRDHDSLAIIMVAAACDESGVSLFTPDDVETLNGLPVEALKAVAEAAMKINKIGEDAYEGGRKN